MAQALPVPRPPACCSPTRLRLARLSSSMNASASRPRVTRGSLDNMVRLEGKFYMGNESLDAFPADGEGPVRHVTLSPYYIGVFEAGERTTRTARRAGHFLRMPLSFASGSRPGETAASSFAIRRAMLFNLLDAMQR